MIRKLTRIHPASVLAMLALFVALGGGAYAAAGKIGSSEIKNGAITKVKIKKEAVTGPKIKNGVVTAAKIQNDTVTGEKVNEATLATVPDAAHLAGRVPAAFESKGFAANSEGFVTVPKEGVKTVASLALPAGTYMVLARGAVNNNSGEALKSSEISCALSAGGVSHEIEFGALAKNGAPGDREEFDTFVLAALPAAGEATLSCDGGSGWSGNVTDPVIVAVSLQP
jgi:hypothetical protein